VPAGGALQPLGPNWWEKMPRLSSTQVGEAVAEVVPTLRTWQEQQKRRDVGYDQAALRERRSTLEILWREIMRIKNTAILLFALASPAAAAETISEKTGINSALGVAPKKEDFVTEAAGSDMTEIAAAKIALEKGDADEKQFANQMVKDHTQTTTELKALVSSGDVQATLPVAPDSASQKHIGKMNVASPADFRSDYDSSQVSAHKNAVLLFERYAKGGDNAKLRDWAQKTLPHLQHHLELANALNQRKK
jgi:putative membrane protein